MKHINESFIRKLVKEEIRKIREEEEPVKRGRGRPRKNPSDAEKDPGRFEAGVDEPKEKKAGRGRPSKYPWIQKQNWYKVHVPDKDAKKVYMLSYRRFKPFKGQVDAPTRSITGQTGQIKFSKLSDSALLVPGWLMGEVIDAFKERELRWRDSYATKLSQQEAEDLVIYNKDTDQEFEVGDKVINVKTQESFKVIELEDNGIVKVQSGNGDVKRIKNYFLQKQE